ncbi:type II CAAX endopeptidase family protein [Gemmatimonadota bacterium CCK-12]
MILLFWAGYLVITLAVGFVTSLLIPSPVWQLTAWGFASSVLLLALSRLLHRGSDDRAAPADAPSGFGLNALAVGLLIGMASFAVHLAVVRTFGGPIRFERVAGVGAVATGAYFLRFLATSCMEEIGFRGYPLRRLEPAIGSWPAVIVTAVVFGLSHLSYGWDLQTIALGVIPGGLLWGMSALATRGLAVPIGLHAAWNFAGWTAGSRSEVGLFRMIVSDEAGGWRSGCSTAAIGVETRALCRAERSRYPSVIPSASAASRRAGESIASGSGFPNTRGIDSSSARRTKRTVVCQSPQNRDHQRRPAAPESHTRRAMGWVRSRRREATSSGATSSRCRVAGSQRSARSALAGPSTTGTTASRRPARVRCRSSIERPRQGWIISASACAGLSAR